MRSQYMMDPRCWSKHLLACQVSIENGNKFKMIDKKITNNRKQRSKELLCGVANPKQNINSSKNNVERIKKECLSHRSVVETSRKLIHRFPNFGKVEVPSEMLFQHTCQEKVMVKPSRLKHNKPMEGC